MGVMRDEVHLGLNKMVRCTLNIHDIDHIQVSLETV